MRRMVLLGAGLIENRIFDRASPANRDDCFAPYVLLRESFLAHGIELNTADVNGNAPVDVELHQDVQAGRGGATAYLMLFETPLVRPVNGSVDALSVYRRIFTWDDSRIDGDRFIKFNFPNPIVIPDVDGFTHRDRFCCIIAGNKAVALRDPRELYSERVRAIRWFEQNAPQDFDLYGTGWDIPPAQPGLVGKFERRFWRLAPPFMRPQPFPSYRGKVDHKRGVLRRTRYSICYENVRDMPGYITEKIFDCFFAGCVPVYWGANNVADHIPSDCYIDRRQFADTAALYAHLKTIDEATYIGFQERIAAFLASDAAKPFGNQFFAETIVSTIVKDIGRSA